MPGPQNNDKAPDIHLAAAYLRERHEARYEARIEIELSGIDRKGNVFREPTFTRDVSKWGCTFLSSIEMAANDMISLRVVSRDAGEHAPRPQSPFQVLRVTHEDEGWLVAAWKLEDRDLWGAAIRMVKPERGNHEPSRAGTASRQERLRKDPD